MRAAGDGPGGDRVSTWVVSWLGCGAPSAPLGSVGVEAGLIVGTVVGGEGRSLVVRGCGAETVVDPRWQTWALQVDRGAVPCVVTLYEGDRVLGGHEVFPGHGAETLCILRPSLGVVVRRSERGLVVVADHHPDQLLHAGDRLVDVAGSGPAEDALWEALERQKSPEQVTIRWERGGVPEEGTLPVVSACDDPVVPTLWRGDGGMPVPIDRAPLSTWLF